jgi:CheY-like chemotaxis protein
VKDTGTGIRPEDVHRLFERFQRGFSKGRSFEGTGIGLALTKELVCLHGGTITVQSELGKGTTFVVMLPRGSKHLRADQIRKRESYAPGSIAPQFLMEASHWSQEAKSSTSPSSESSRFQADSRSDHSSDGCRSDTVERNRNDPDPSSTPTWTMTKKETILIVDDNLDMRNYLKDLLSPIARVLTAPDGSVAVRMIQESQPSLILTDVMMPVMNGLQLLRHIKSDEKLRSIPVILLSARAGEESRVEGIERGTIICFCCIFFIFFCVHQNCLDIDWYFVGHELTEADDYIVKPFSAKELVARVNLHMDLGRMRRNLVQELERRTVQLEQSTGIIVQQAQERTKHLEDMNRKQEQFMDTLCHELRYLSASLDLVERSDAISFFLFAL